MCVEQYRIKRNALTLFCFSCSVDHQNAFTDRKRTNDVTKTRSGAKHKGGLVTCEGTRATWHYRLEISFTSFQALQMILKK